MPEGIRAATKSLYYYGYIAYHDTHYGSAFAPRDWDDSGGYICRRREAKDGSHLYIFKFNDGISDFYKIGISKHPERRLKNLKRDGDLEFLEGTSYFFENSEEAWYIEKDVHQMLSFYKYKPVNNFYGFTECFKSVNIDHVYDYLNFVVSGLS